MIEGRLNSQSCYMVGPIEACADFGREWRQNMTPFLKNLGVYVLDPKNKPIKCELDMANEDDDAVKKRHSLLAEGKYDEFTQGMKRIRNCDLRFVDKADFLVVNYDLSIPMCGTYEEIFTANREKKPIIIMCPQGKNKISPWLFGTLRHDLFFESWDQVEMYLWYIHKSEQIDTLGGRWLFFQ